MDFASLWLPPQVVNLYSEVEEAQEETNVNVVIEHFNWLAVV
jgi:hypothetical protein